jgi:hypothetical protein
MSDRAGGRDSRRAETPSDEDQDDDSDAGTQGGTPAASPDSMGGVRTGEAKAAINREVDPPA